MTEFADLVDRSLGDAARREFERRVDAQADHLCAAILDGRLDNPGFGLGIELEVYAVDDEGRLARVPEDAFDGRCEKELGLHNAELHTTATRFDDDGIAAQAAELARDHRVAQRAARGDDVSFVLDAMWTVPPPGGTRAYLDDIRSCEGWTIAANMTPSPRYYAIENDVLDRRGGTISFEVPGADLEFPSILVESLTSSIQPHLQIPSAEAFPRYHNVAIGTLGPVLALATNSPLLPTDLYDVDDLHTVDGEYDLLDETYHELRIPVFEGSINGGWRKVRFPDEVRRPTDVVDLLVEDPTCAPFLREWIADGEREAFEELFWELDHKRGTYWRWLRAVLGGQPVGDGDEWSIRLEYRPLPTQPTVVDNIGFLCLVAGLVRGLADHDHPLASLERDIAERCFYDVVENGLDADLAWITADGARTSDRREIYGELFEFARLGLAEGGASPETVSRYLDPIEERWTSGTTPSRWKLDRVREGLDAGEEFEDAVHAMQLEYGRLSATGEPFARWPGIR